MQRENKWQDRLRELKCINGALYFGSLEDSQSKCNCGEPKCNNQTYYEEGINEIINFIQSEINTAIADERKRAQEEYRQFILNLLDGIDIADGECGTKAIRHAIKSRLIE